ncbi:methyl-accepting chemotaxis protein [Actinoplanes sp. NPDC049802]|uniref:methyl-accepting chemotaxis protein n=1 Tax=Actinoplanes sp. NPDC049802 TaxID=3154742 RepID=UPI0033EE5E59
MRLFARSAAQPDVATDEQARYRDAVARVVATLRALHQGDFEARVPALDGAPELKELRDVLNEFIDINDAFIRESAASLSAASQGEYHRRFLTRGMKGAYRNAAERIDTGREQMSDTADTLAQGERDRAELADRIQLVAEQVAAASTELGASADTLAGSARRVVGRTDAAVLTVEALRTSSEQIQQAVLLIKHIAAQTRLLALNATIEAARAGASGRGFAVVANEVKTLADMVNQSSDDIAAQVATAQHTAGDAAEAIHEIAVLVAEMDQQVGGVAIAANGDGSGQHGLSQMAESLRGEIEHLAAG